MDKIKTVIEKEWAEVFKNRIVLFTVAFLPLILTALPLVTLAFMGDMGEGAVKGETPDEFFGALCVELSEVECVQVFTLNLYTLMLMILPVAIPVTIAAYSIVGEKTAHSLEPLLATPITTLELVAGKTAAAAIPAVAATWLAYGLYVVGGRLLVNDAIFSHMIEPVWLIAIFAVSPLLTLMSVSVAIMVSSRASDPRMAEQLSAVVILPIILLIAGQSVGYILLDQQLILIIGAAVALLDIVLVYLSVRTFQRETILTRWK
ncbi:MAG: ABC transporter permease subunit [Anaerolineae bacterium]